MLPVNLKPETHLAEGQIQNLKNQGEHLKGLANKSDQKKLISAARNFESFMLSFMFKEMYKSIPKSEVFGKTHHKDIFMGLYMDEVTKKAKLSNTGIASQLIKQYTDQKPLKDDLNNISSTTSNFTTQISDKIKELAGRFKLNKSAKKIFRDFATMIDKIDHKLSSDYGMRIHPISGQDKLHEGTDFALNTGTKVKLPSKGEVIFAGDNGGYGKTVIVDHGHGITSLYAHLSEITVKVGDRLGKKALVGKVGSTGVSTGPHLHFEVRKDGKTIDPMHLVSKQKTKDCAKAADKLE